MNKGKLYIVATPIGNLGDITLRAIETLKNADIILCEDTRVTKNLLEYFQINKPLISYHQHSNLKKVREIIKLLNEGKNLALVTDAGTPGISDPGNLLVRDIIQNYNNSQMVAAVVADAHSDAIIPIPGPSAVITALSISGFPTDKFIFMGFPPHKNKRQKFFKAVADAEYTVVFYESGHRILKCLGELKNILSTKRQIMVCRELTKKFETIYRGTAMEITETMKDKRGEFVVVVS